MYKQRCDPNSCRANVRIMYELCPLKKEQKEENEELSIFYRGWKSRKKLYDHGKSDFFRRRARYYYLYLLFLKDNINQDSKIMMMNVYLAAALAVVPTLFSPSFLRIFNLPMAACIL